MVQQQPNLANRLGRGRQRQLGSLLCVICVSENVSSACLQSTPHKLIATQTKRNVCRRGACNPITFRQGAANKIGVDDKSSWSPVLGHLHGQWWSKYSGSRHHNDDNDNDDSS